MSSPKALIDALSRLVGRSAPGLEPTVKWGQGCWTLGGSPRVYIHTAPDHVQFGFFAGSRLADPERLLAGSGKHVRHVKLFPARRMPRKALVALLEQVR